MEWKFGDEEREGRRKIESETARHKKARRTKKGEGQAGKGARMPRHISKLIPFRLVYI